MIAALSKFEPLAAAGILARAVLALDDETNPDSRAILPDEPALRKQILREVRRNVGVAEDDESPQANDRVEDAIDKELEVLTGKTDVERVLKKLADKGEVPSDLYRVHVIENVQDFYGDRWPAEHERVLETVRSADQEEHFGPEPRLGPHLISLFSKYFPHKYPFQSFTLLVIGQREGLDLRVHQVWRLYADRVVLKDATDLVDLLRRFCDEFGMEFEINGQRGRLVLSVELAKGVDWRQEIHILPVYGTDSRGRRVLKELPLFTLTNFRHQSKDNKTNVALTVVVNLERYKAALEAHSW